MLALLLAAFTGYLFTMQVAALRQRIGDMQRVVVAKAPIAARALITADMLETREIPRIYAHASYFQNIEDVASQRVAATALDAGMIVRENDVTSVSGLNDGARAISIGVNPISVQVNRVTPGSRVDVLVSREGDRGEPGRTLLALEGVEVLNAAPHAGSGGSGPGGPGADAPRVAASLRVTLRQAVFLAAAQSFAREMRLLPRAPGDLRRGAAGLTIDSSLGG